MFFKDIWQLFYSVDVMRKRLVRVLIIVQEMYFIPNQLPDPYRSAIANTDIPAAKGQCMFIIWHVTDTSFNPGFGHLLTPIQSLVGTKKGFFRRAGVFSCHVLALCFRLFDIPILLRLAKSHIKFRFDLLEVFVLFFC